MFTNYMYLLILTTNYKVKYAQGFYITLETEWPETHQTQFPQLGSNLPQLLCTDARRIIKDDCSIICRKELCSSPMPSLHTSHYIKIHIHTLELAMYGHHGNWMTSTPPTGSHYSVELLFTVHTLGMKSCCSCKNKSKVTNIDTQETIWDQSQHSMGVFTQCFLDKTYCESYRCTYIP